MEQAARHQCAGSELLRKLMSQEPKTERKKLYGGRNVAGGLFVSTDN